jgi:hypothetical protein
VLGQPRATQRRRSFVRDDEAPPTASIIRLASAYGRYGYRRIRALLRGEGWRVNLKRVYRIRGGKGSKCRRNNPNAAVCG